MVGSNILNVLVILGLTALIVPLHVKKSTICFEMPYVVVTSILLCILGLTDSVVSFADGVILCGGMVLFLLYLLKLAKRGETEEEKTESADKKLWLLLVMAAGGLGLIILGSNVTVNSATAIAEAFGVSDRIIGLTIVALGTSLPELVTSVTAALKGNADIAVGNIVGSNIFNILFVVGLTALITPVEYAGEFFIDSFICIGSAALLWIFTIKNKVLGRAGGIVMLICYGGYLAYLL